VPSKQKINLEKVKASLFTVCLNCGQLRQLQVIATSPTLRTEALTAPVKISSDGTNTAVDARRRETSLSHSHDQRLKITFARILYAQPTSGLLVPFNCSWRDVR
jgi:hypothetical protein